GAKELVSRQTIERNRATYVEQKPQTPTRQGRVTRCPIKIVSCRRRPLGPPTEPAWLNVASTSPSTLAALLSNICALLELSNNQPGSKAPYHTDPFRALYYSPSPPTGVCRCFPSPAGYCS